MEKQVVLVGTLVALSGGQSQDLRKRVEFVGERLAERTEFGYSDRTGGPTDTRGTTETLYKAEDGRYIVHVDAWSKWQGEPGVESLHQVDKDNLMPGGEFADLGYEAGMWKSMSLDDALTPHQDAPEG